VPGVIPARVARERRTWTEVGAYRLHDRRWGASGRPIVLVHGLGVSSSYWRRLGATLGRADYVAAPDLPGFGRSARPREVLDIAGLAHVLAAWQETAGLGRAALVANSLGCQVAVEAAARRPELVDALVLLGPTVDTSARSFARQLGRLLLDSTREPVNLTALVAGEYLRVGPRRLAVTFAAALRQPLLETLARVQAPVLVVRGERDPIAPLPWIEELASRAPGGRTVVVAGAAHAAHWSRPERVAALVAGFLGQA
jgi:2-hydroxy-6-oxonona-2,4-dienedioate hydrolase